MKAHFSDNNDYLEPLQSKKLSERQELLNDVAKQAATLTFSFEQLNDPEYVKSHKEQAIRHLYLKVYIVK